MGHQSYVLLFGKMTSFPPSEWVSEINFGSICSRSLWLGTSSIDTKAFMKSLIPVLRKIKAHELSLGSSSWAFKDEGPWQGYLIGIII